MPIFERFSRWAIKALKPYAHGDLSHWGWRSGTAGYLPGARADYEAEAGDVWMNGAVSAALGWLVDNFPEPEMVVERRKRNGEWELVDEHPLIKLIDDPNGSYDSYSLWQATLISDRCDGNGYWIKSAATTGLPMAVWYVPHWEIYPVRKPGSGDFISHYERQLGGKLITYGPSEVVHFRAGLDPRDPTRGLSRLRAALRSISADNLADTYTAAILRNSGVVGPVISPANPGEIIDPENAEAIKQKFRDRRGESAGDAIALFKSVKVDWPDCSPERMALDVLRNLPEDRICAALGVNPMVCGLTSGGLQKTYANYAEARRAAYESGLMPLQSRFAETLYRAFPELVDRRERVRWTYDDVAAMQESATEKIERGVKAYQGGLCTLGKAQELAGLEVDPDPEVADLYYGESPEGEEEPDFEEEEEEEEEDEEEEEFVTGSTKAAGKPKRKRKDDDDDGGPIRKGGTRPHGKPFDEGEHPRGGGGKFRDKPDADGDAVPGQGVPAGVKQRVEALAASKGLDVKVEAGPPRTKGEAAFMAKAHARGKEAMVVTSEPKARVDSAGETTRYIVGGKEVATVSSDPSGGGWTWRSPVRGGGGKADEWTYKTRAEAEGAGKSSMRGEVEVQRNVDRLAMSPRKLATHDFEDQVGGAAYRDYSTNIRILTRSSAAKSIILPSSIGANGDG